MILAVMNAIYAIAYIEAWKFKDFNGVWTRDLAIPVRPLTWKKDWIKLLLFKKWSHKIAAAVILLGPKRLRVLVMSQCEITPRGLSNARLRIFELLGGMHSICVRFMVYIPPINNKLGPTNMAPMASKTWVLKQWVARSSLYFRSVGATL